MKVETEQPSINILRQQLLQKYTRPLPRQVGLIYLQTTCFRGCTTFRSRWMTLFSCRNIIPSAAPCRICKRRFHGKLWPFKRYYVNVTRAYILSCINSSSAFSRIHTGKACVCGHRKNLTQYIMDIDAK